MEFITFVRFSTLHPDYANVSPWAFRPGLAFFRNVAETPAAAKMMTLRLISRAGGGGAYQDAVTYINADVPNPFSPNVLPDTPDWVIF